MPSKSAAQAKLMAIAAHKPGGYGGVPQKVGAEFHSADKSKARFKYSGATGSPKTKTMSGRRNHGARPGGGY